MKNEEIYRGVVQESQVKISIHCYDSRRQIQEGQTLLTDIIQYPDQHVENGDMTIAKAFISDIEALDLDVKDEPLDYMSRVMTYGLKYTREYVKTKITMDAETDDPMTRVDIDIDEELRNFYRARDKEVRQKFPRIKKYFQMARAEKPGVSQAKGVPIPEKALVLELMKEGIKGYLAIPREVKDEDTIYRN